MWKRKPALSRNLSPWASGWASGEREKHNADGHKTGVNILQSLFGLQLPLTHKRYNKMSGTYFFKEVLARLLFIASICIQHIYVLCVCIVNHGHGYWAAIQHLYIHNGIMVKASSNSSRPITFTFGQILSQKVWIPSSSTYGLNSATSVLL